MWTAAFDKGTKRQGLETKAWKMIQNIIKYLILELCTWRTHFAQDIFGPVKNDALRLPEEVTVHFVDTAEAGSWHLVGPFFWTVCVKMPIGNGLPSGKLT